jgi:hypothetical protein
MAIILGSADEGYVSKLMDPAKTGQLSDNVGEINTNV